MLLKTYHLTKITVEEEAPPSIIPTPVDTHIHGKVLAEIEYTDGDGTMEVNLEVGRKYVVHVECMDNSTDYWASRRAGLYVDDTLIDAPNGNIFAMITITETTKSIWVTLYNGITNKV